MAAIEEIRSTDRRGGRSLPRTWLGPMQIWRKVADFCMRKSLTRSLTNFIVKSNVRTRKLKYLKIYGTSNYPCRPNF